MSLRGMACAAAALLLVAIGSAQAQDPPPASSQPSAKELVAKLANPDPAAAKAAADAVVLRGADAVPDLIAALDDQTLKAPALAVIERLGPTAKDAVPRITLLLKGPTSPARGAASKAVGAMGADGAPAIGALTSIVQQTKAKDRREAVEAIRWILLDVARQVPRPKELSPAEDAIRRGCSWLVRHQDPEGVWGDVAARCTAAKDKCGPVADPRYTLGVTGLATMALLGAGRAQDPMMKASAVSALSAIVAGQGGNGMIGAGDSLKATYIHAVAGRALADGWTRTRRPELREPLERAVKFALSIQHQKGGGWRYDIVPGGKESDTSITAWMAGLLQTAADGGLDVDPKGLENAKRWTLSMTEPEFGRTGYQQKGGMSARTKEMQDRFPANLSESLTACGLVVRLLDGKGDEYVEKSAALLLAKTPAWQPETGATDFYYWMQGSDAMRRLGGKSYIAWRRPLIAALLPSQAPDSAGCAAGSWPAIDPWVSEAGTVYATAAAVLALESCVEDPATRPALTPAQKQAVVALEAAREGAGEELLLAIDRAVRAIRESFR